MREFEHKGQLVQVEVIRERNEPLPIFTAEREKYEYMQLLRRSMLMMSSLDQDWVLAATQHEYEHAMKDIWGPGQFNIRIIRYWYEKNTYEVILPEYNPIGPRTYAQMLQIMQGPEHLSKMDEANVEKIRFLIELHPEVAEMVGQIGKARARG